MDKSKLIEFYTSHRWKINGAAIGILIAVIILTIGFLKTVFIGICGLIGYYLGKKLSEDEDYIKNLLDKILPPGSYR